MVQWHKSLNRNKKKIISDQSHHINRYINDILPKIVMDGFNFPSTLNNGRFSIFANGLFGSGSDGVPSTRDQQPILVFRPTIACKMSEWSSITALSRTIDSFNRTPLPIITPGPMDTFGPSCDVGKEHCNACMKYSITIYCSCWMNDRRRMYINVLYNVAD